MLDEEHHSDAKGDQITASATPENPGQSVYAHSASLCSQEVFCLGLKITRQARGDGRAKTEEKWNIFHTHFLWSGAGESPAGDSIPHLNL